MNDLAVMQDLLGLGGQLGESGRQAQALERPVMAHGSEPHDLLGGPIEAGDLQPGIQDDQGEVHTVLDALEVRVERRQLGGLDHQLLVDGRQLLIAGLHLLVERLHLLVAGLQLLDHRLQVLARRDQLLFQHLRIRVWAAGLAGCAARRRLGLEADEEHLDGLVWVIGADAQPDQAGTAWHHPPLTPFGLFALGPSPVHKRKELHAQILTKHVRELQPRRPVCELDVGAQIAQRMDDVETRIQQDQRGDIGPEGELVEDAVDRFARLHRLLAGHSTKVPAQGLGDVVMCRAALGSKDPGLDVQRLEQVVLLGDVLRAPEEQQTVGSQRIMEG
jgi:hypothetical protein